MIQKESEYTEQIMLMYRAFRRSNRRGRYAPIVGLERGMKLCDIAEGCDECFEAFFGQEMMYDLSDLRCWVEQEDIDCLNSFISLCIV